jgi:hypothetical protein
MADSPIAITATLNSTNKTANLTVKAPALSLLTVSPGSVTGGGPASATVKLTGLAPPGGVSVALTSANPAVATVPSSVVVTAGAQTATVAVTSVPVASDVPVVLTGSLNGLSKSNTITIKAPTVSALALSPTSVIGGATATATVTLSGNAPVNGVTVLLTSDQPAIAGVPGTVSVIAGAKNASYTVATSTVAVDTVVTISATANGAGKTNKLTVRK